LDIPVKSFGKKRKPDAMPLFETDVVDEPEDVVPTANDEALALALQQEELGSDEEQPDQDLARALALSRREADRAKDREQATTDDEQDSDDDMEEVHTGAASGLADEDLQGHESDESLEEVSLAPTAEATPVILSEDQTPIEAIDTDEDDIVEMPAPKRLDSSHVVNGDGALKRLDKALVAEQENHAKSGTTSASMPAPPPPTAPQVKSTSSTTRISSTSKAQQPESLVTKATTPAKPPSTAATPNIAGPSSLKKSLTSLPPPPSRTPPSTPPQTLKALANHGDSHLPDFHPETPEQRQRKAQQETGINLMPVELRSPHRRGAASLLAFMDPADERDPLMDLQPTRELSRSVSTEQLEDTYEDEDDRDDDERDEDEDDDEPIEWSRSPSPTIHRQRPPLNPEESTESIPFEAEEDGAGMDRADMVAEEDDYARFMAQIKNRNLDEVRGEIDDEIRILHNQAKVSLRDSDEISAAMVAQIQTLLRHFGIPYITAPMEAEAQCAKLAELNLVDGVITDDSDVFLFGGKQCFKNIFNDSKYAECFLLTDIDRELSLTRERLISLAYLLGSDYTIGLPGVGPVVALELLANFPGETGISDFKAWWMKVQRGQDTEEETNTKWKASFVSATVK
jgi:DNA excision repair protein ERCC-5